MTNTFKSFNNLTAPRPRWRPPFCVRTGSRFWAYFLVKIPLGNRPGISYTMPLSPNDRAAKTQPSRFRHPLRRPRWQKYAPSGGSGSANSPPPSVIPARSSRSGPASRKVKTSHHHLHKNVLQIYISYLNSDLSSKNDFLFLSFEFSPAIFHVQKQFSLRNNPREISTFSAPLPPEYN